MRFSNSNIMISNPQRTVWPQMVLSDSFKFYNMYDICSEFNDKILNVKLIIKPQTGPPPFPTHFWLIAVSCRKDIQMACLKPELSVLSLQVDLWLVYLGH